MNLSNVTTIRRNLSKEGSISSSRKILMTGKRSGPGPWKVVNIPVER